MVSIPREIPYRHLIVRACRHLTRFLKYGFNPSWDPLITPNCKAVSTSHEEPKYDFNPSWDVNGCCYWPTNNQIKKQTNPKQKTNTKTNKRIILNMMTMWLSREYHNMIILCSYNDHPMIIWWSSEYHLMIIWISSNDHLNII